MTVAEFFTCADQLPFADLPALVGDGGVLIVAPHPDDESLGCGGLISLCIDAGRRTQVAIVSDGTGSHRNSRKVPHDALLNLRESEAVAACAALGMASSSVAFLRLPDQSVPQSGVAAEAAITRLVTMARGIAASAIVVSWRRDPHCDHQASFALVQAVTRRLPSMRLLEYPVWGHTLSADTTIDDEPRGQRLDIAAVIDRKRAAIAAHRSQGTRLIDDDPDGFMLPPEMIARFERPFEIYLENA